MTNNQMYKKIFTDVFGIDESGLDASFTFADIEEWDSLTHLTLISELEDSFDVMFETDDILNFGGYENGINILKKYGVKFED